MRCTLNQQRLGENSTQEIILNLECFLFVPLPTVRVFSLVCKVCYLAHILHRLLRVAGARSGNWKSYGGTAALLAGSDRRQLLMGLTFGNCYLYLCVDFKRGRVEKWGTNI